MTFVGALWRQHRELERLRHENAGLREVNLTRSTTSDGSADQVEELKQLRKEHWELPRLRGEVAELRRKVRENQTFNRNVRVDPSRSRSQLVAKLDTIVLKEVLYDGVTFSQAVQDLNAEVLSQDPEQLGVNIVLSNRAVDETEKDMSQVVIRLNLTNVRLVDVIDALCKVSEEPAEYAVNTDGVVIRPRCAWSIEPLLTQTFRFDAGNISQYINFGSGGGGIPQSVTTFQAPAIEDPTEQLRTFFMAAGVDFPTNSVAIDQGQANAPNAPQGKALFYNSQTGLLLVRGTREDLDIVEKAVQVVEESTNTPSP